MRIPQKPKAESETLNRRIKRWVEASRSGSTLLTASEFAAEIGLTRDALHQRVSRMGLSKKRGAA